MLRVRFFVRDKSFLTVWVTQRGDPACYICTPASLAGVDICHLTETASIYAVRASLIKASLSMCIL